VGVGDDVLARRPSIGADTGRVCHGKRRERVPQGQPTHCTRRHPTFGRSPTQSLTDGELFYAIEQRHSWTGMPAWTTGTDEGARELGARPLHSATCRISTPDEVTRIDGLMPEESRRSQARAGH